MKMKGDAKIGRIVPFSTLEESVDILVPLGHALIKLNVATDIPKVYVMNGKAKEHVQEEISAGSVTPESLLKVIF